MQVPCIGVHCGSGYEWEYSKSLTVLKDILLVRTIFYDTNDFFTWRAKQSTLHIVHYDNAAPKGLFTKDYYRSTELNEIALREQKENWFLHQYHTNLNVQNQ